jgi:glutaredoxin
METQVLGLSVDSEPCLKAWADSMGGIAYPLISDFYPHGKVARKYGVLRSDGRSERAIFVIDRQGIIRYIDIHDIDTQPDNDLLLRVLSEMDPTIADAYAAQQAEAMSTVEPVADIVMYCTPWCQDCPQARQYFKEKNIPYVEVDISRDRAAAARVRGWTGGDESTPTINIRGEILLTFDQARVEAALKKKR